MEKGARRKKASKSSRKKQSALGKSSKAAEAAFCSSHTAETREKPQDENKLSLITWNVNGRDAVLQPERLRALCDCLTSYSPDVVFLQVVTLYYAHFLHSHLDADYTIIEGGTEEYFTMMLLKKSRITLEKSRRVYYAASHMKRNLLVARVLFKGHKFCLMTSQFESLKTNAAERKRQLRLVVLRISKACDDVTVLFGGDTSLRQAEVAEVGLPSGICDVWEQLGKPVHCRYTLDTETNTNMNMKFEGRFRSNRVYLRQATMGRVPQLEPDSMALVGLEKLQCGRFISEHWGIYCTFTFTNKTK